jgi:hypothetical protein
LEEISQKGYFFFVFRVIVSCVVGDEIILFENVRSERKSLSATFAIIAQISEIEISMKFRYLRESNPSNFKPMFED